MESEIIYLCDGKKCDKCRRDCFHTTDINHALYFEKMEDGRYIEKLNAKDGDDKL